MGVLCACCGNVVYSCYTGFRVSPFERIHYCDDCLPPHLAFEWGTGDKEE